MVRNLIQRVWLLSVTEGTLTGRRWHLLESIAFLMLYNSMIIKIHLSLKPPLAPFNLTLQV